MKIGRVIRRWQSEPIENLEPSPPLESPVPSETPPEINPPDRGEGSAVDSEPGSTAEIGLVTSSVSSAIGTPGNC